MIVPAEEILAFWSYEVTPAHWFDRDDAFDVKIQERFAETYEAAQQGNLDSWQETPEGALALLILIDHLPPHLFPNNPRAYENEDWAIDIARESIIRHFDDRIDKSYKLIFYLPFMHSESLGNQRLSLFYIRERTKEDKWLAMAEQAYEVISCYGRFPERNAALGRETTTEEDAYLKTLS